jgi:hypothetical protein
MSSVQHIVTDLHKVYLTEMEAKIQPKIGQQSGSSDKSSSEKSSENGGSEDKLKKQARQLAYDTRYKARREGIPLERAFTQTLQNSSASGPVRDLAKSMLFSGGVRKEGVEIEESDKKMMVLVTPAKGYGKPYRRYATRKKIHQLRSNPQIQSVTGTNYGEPYEGERKKGEQTSSALQHKLSEKTAKKDYDGDGKLETSTQEWKGSRDNAIKKAIKKSSEDVKESIFDWRSELHEVISNADSKTKKQISKKKNTIVVAPTLDESINNIGGKLIEVFEINEEFINNSVESVTDYLYESGINEDGVDIIIDEVGIDNFVDFVFSSDFVLSEARSAKRRRKGEKPYEQIKAEIDAKEKAKKKPQTSKELETKKTESDKKSVDDAITTARKTQGSKKPVRDAIARNVFRAVNAYKSGMERHRAAMKTAKKAAPVAQRVAQEFGKGVTAGVKTAGKSAKAAYDVVKDEVENDVVGDNQLQEKSLSVSQQQAAGAALAAKRGEIEPSELKGASLQMYKSMSEKELRDFAKTKHKRLPDKKEVEESVTPTSSLSSKQKEIERQQTQNSRERMSRIRQLIQQQIEKDKKMGRRPSGRSLQNSEYEPEGNQIDEGLRSAVKRLLGGRKKEEETPKPMSRGDQLRKKYNVGPERSDTSAKRQILNRTRAKAERDQEQYGGSQYTKSVADKSQAAHNRYLRGGYSKYGADDRRGSGNKARRRAAALQNNEFEWLIDSLLDEGYDLSAYTVEQFYDFCINELNRAEKETGINTKTGKPIVPGGSMKGDKAFQSVSTMVRSMQGRPKGQKPKVKGKKPPAAGEFGGPKFPAQKVAQRRAAAKRAQEFMSDTRRT